MAVAIVYLGFAGIRSGWVYYVGVDEYAVDAAAHHARSRVFGIVGDGAESHPAELTARFTLMGTGATLPVEYHGAIPDMFAAGRQVVIEGRMDERGVFVADVLMTKCASKYAPREAGSSG
ncbi:MAG: cytochrome c maturation protein CcmE [Phycisphaerales bacterium]|nr:cytochrome c maturation protein CcmE [Phycisphaerales bacterium]